MENVILELKNMDDTFSEKRDKNSYKISKDYENIIEYLYSIDDNKIPPTHPKLVNSKSFAHPPFRIQV